MAYSNWGAFVWKNGENITATTCDLSNDYSGGHALLDFGEFSIEFYKNYEPVIKFADKSKKNIEVKCLKAKSWNNKKIKIRIVGYSLDNNEIVNAFQISHNDNNYFVICGMSVGKGFEKCKLSKYLLKNVRYDDGRKWHWIKTKFDANVGDVVDKMQRLDMITFERFSNWQFCIKPFLKRLLKFKFDSFYFKEMMENFYKIHLMK